MTWTRTDVSLSYNSTGAKASQPGILGNTVWEYTAVGAGNVQLQLEMSNDNAGWEIADSILLTGAGDHTFSVNVNSWRWWRINVIAITATSVSIETSGG